MMPPTILSSRMLLAVTIAFFLITLPSCKNEESNPSGPPPGDGYSGTVSDSARSATLDSLSSFINRLPQVSKQADNQAVYHYVQSRQEFEESGMEPSGVWARFRDGRVWTFINDFPLEDTSGIKTATWPDITPSPHHSAAPAENLPDKSNARVMNALGPLFDHLGFSTRGMNDLAQELRSWLQQAGYTPVNSEPTIDGLKGVADDGVFYLSTHGGSAKLRDSNWVYGLWTATPCSPITDLIYKEDLDSGRIGYAEASHSREYLIKTKSEKHYMITQKFVHKYMSFGPRCVVFINACTSAQPTIRDAIIAKGANLYMGWSNVTDAAGASRVARYFFDRALGANQASPVLSPPQKGYQLYDIYGYMTTHDLAYATTKEFGRSDLLSHPPAPDATMLRPFIYTVHPSANEFRILGWFGENPGQGAASVTVGTKVVPIRNWYGATTIVCDPVQDGGDVVVTVRGRRSHPVPLTKFSGLFNYTLHGRGSLTKTVSVSYEFLADVRTNRTRVDEAPKWELPRPIFALNTTGASYEASGEYRDNNGNLVEAWSGSGNLTLVQNVSAQGITLTGLIDRSGFGLSAVTIEAKAPYVVNGAASTFFIEYGVGSLKTVMNDSFVIPGEMYTGGSGTEEASGQFSGGTPTYAPTGETVR